MTSKSIAIGDFTITALFDGEFEAPSDVIQHQGGEARRQAALSRWGEAVIRIPVNCFLLERGADVMLVDTGAGTAWGPSYGKMRTAIAAAGVSPDMVGRILLTHLHGDHALGLLEDGKAYFPNAQVVAPSRDLVFFTNPRIREETPKARRGGFEIAAHVAAAYGARLIAAQPGKIMPGVSLVPLPGHTPGHSGYKIESKGQTLLFWGDTLHLGTLQSADPDIGLVFDLDGALAAETRHAVLAELADGDTIVAGGHLGEFMRIERGARGGYTLTRAPG